MMLGSSFLAVQRPAASTTTSALTSDEQADWGTTAEESDSTTIASSETQAALSNQLSSPSLAEAVVARSKLGGASVSSRASLAPTEVSRDRLRDLVAKYDKKTSSGDQESDEQ
jgi:hypothetical protein